VAGNEQELGVQLLAIVAAARSRGLDAERALRGALRGLRASIRDREAETSQPAAVPKASPSR
jgi:XTP/dITP diphosphohydrolase